jgi:hypothetical protein
MKMLRGRWHLGLRWPPIDQRNNQPRVGGSGRGDVIAEVGGGGGAEGDPDQSFGVVNGMTKKLII